MVGKSFPSPENQYLQAHAKLIADSYYRLLNKPLISVNSNDKTLGYRLFYAPFVVVSHGVEKEPVFNYANQAALKLFEFDWAEFVSLPSRLSAEPVNQTERDRLLKEVSENGFIDHYEGVRISKTGKRFRIRNAVVWNLIDNRNVYCGQAACFDEWTFLD